MAADSSLKGLMKDKRVQLAAAGVGGVGLLVLLMRRGGGGETVTQIRPAAGLDSSGSDFYNAMQQLGQGWQQDMRDLIDQQKNVVDQLPKTPTGGTGATPRVQYYHPDIDPTVGKYKVTSGAETWTNNIKTLAFAYGWTDPYKVWNDPANAALRKKYGNNLPTGNLAPGDTVYATLNPKADWKALFPDPYDKDPYGSAKRRGLVQ